MPAKHSRNSQPTTDDYDGTLLVNCARCGRELLGLGQQPTPFHQEHVAGRVYGRPHCRVCLPYAKREPKPVESRFHISPQE